MWTSPHRLEALPQSLQLRPPESRRVSPTPFLDCPLGPARCIYHSVLGVSVVGALFLRVMVGGAGVAATNAAYVRTRHTTPRMHAWYKLPWGHWAGESNAPLSRQPMMASEPHVGPGSPKDAMPVHGAAAHMCGGDT